MINSTEHNYRRLISPTSQTSSYVIFSTAGYPEYGFINSLTQSLNLNTPTGYVGANVLGSSRLIKAPNGDVYAYGLSFSNTGFGESLMTYKSTNNGTSFTGVSRILSNLGASADSNPCVSVAFSGTTYSMVINRSTYSNVLYSTNAVNWTLGASYSVNIIKVLWVPEKSLFYYPVNSSTWYTSTNGSTLTTFAQDATNTYISDLIYCSGLGKFVKSFTNGTSFREGIAMSTNGASWSFPGGIEQHWGGIQSLSYSPDLNKVYCAAVNNSAGAGASQDILTNLSESIYINTVDSDEKRSVAWLSKSQMFVMPRGANKDLWYSKDGLNWSTISSAYPAFSPGGLPSGWNAFNISTGTGGQNNILEL
jgi:hypothetical protein